MRMMELDNDAWVDRFWIFMTVLLPGCLIHEKAAQDAL